MVYTTDTNTAHAPSTRKKVRIPALLEAKGTRRLSATTCYDATFARLIERSPIDIVLVGDSLGHVVQGLTSTIPVSVADIEYHVKCVSRVLRTPLLVADMPFGTTGLDDRHCFEAASRLMVAGAEAIKMEGASERTLQQIQTLTGAGIPVMGHIGLTPQSVHALGGYRVQGRSEEQLERLVQSAQDLENAGCFSVVLELCTHQAGSAVTKSVTIPTIGIGSGVQCDGQILVLHDMLGMNKEFRPKFLKHFEQLEDRIGAALAAYDSEVKKGTFPEPE
jgi:3-methyl-2-oxobutanoate hydroxymethyltransferase